MKQQEIKQYLKAMENPTVLKLLGSISRWQEEHCTGQKISPEEVDRIVQGYRQWLQSQIVKKEPKVKNYDLEQAIKDAENGTY